MKEWFTLANNIEDFKKEYERFKTENVLTEGALEFLVYSVNKRAKMIRDEINDHFQYTYSNTRDYDYINSLSAKKSKLYYIKEFLLHKFMKPISYHVTTYYDYYQGVHNVLNEYYMTTNYSFHNPIQSAKSGIPILYIGENFFVDSSTSDTVIISTDECISMWEEIRKNKPKFELSKETKAYGTDYKLISPLLNDLKETIRAQLSANITPKMIENHSSEGVIKKKKVKVWDNDGELIYDDGLNDEIIQLLLDNDAYSGFCMFHKSGNLIKNQGLVDTFEDYERRAKNERNKKKNLTRIISEFVKDNADEIISQTLVKHPDFTVPKWRDRGFEADNILRAMLYAIDVPGDAKNSFYVGKTLLNATDFIDCLPETNIDSFSQSLTEFTSALKNSDIINKKYKQISRG